VPKLLVGLGNPGQRYEGTRHNVGFEAVDRIVQAAGGRWRKSTDRAVEAEASFRGRIVSVMKPLTYMNLSGGPVAEWAREHAVAPEEILVYFDDVALPIGTLRLRERGSDGGHRGLASVIEELGSTDVPRVRIGIRPAGPEPRGELADFVLSRFSPPEREVVDEVLERVVEATGMILSEGMGKAMSRYNSVIVGEAPSRREG
jgi:PTH1 family peptidyl-tRNA hydrolase